MSTVRATRLARPFHLDFITQKFGIQKVQVMKLLIYNFLYRSVTSPLVVQIISSDTVMCDHVFSLRWQNDSPKWRVKSLFLNVSVKMK
jgi:hypothetical protein